MDNAVTEQQLEEQIAAALRSEPETWTPDCLPSERILALVERALPEAEAVPLMAHVALCARCRQEYAETVELVQLSEEARQWEPQPDTSLAATPLSETILAPEPSVSPEHTALPAPVSLPSRFAFLRQWLSPGMSFAFGAAATGILLIAAFVVPSRVQRGRLEGALRQREAQIAQAEQKQREQEKLLAALRNAGEGETTRLTERLTQLKGRVKAQEMQIARLEEDSAVLEQMSLPTADWLAALPGGGLRSPNDGRDPAPAITLLHPVNASVRDANPILECRPLPGVKTYEITLVKEGSIEEVPPPTLLAATRWKVAAPLEPGVVYQWSVSAWDNNKEYRSPVGRFRLLTAAQRQEIETARAKYAQKPLLLGAIYARMGLRDEAQQLFRAALKTNPNSTVAKRWLQQSQEARP